MQHRALAISVDVQKENKDVKWTEGTVCGRLCVLFIYKYVLYVNMNIMNFNNLVFYRT